MAFSAVLNFFSEPALLPPFFDPDFSFFSKLLGFYFRFAVFYTAMVY
jgi:hypothetical protein